MAVLSLELERPKRSATGENLAENIGFGERGVATHP